MQTDKAGISTTGLPLNPQKWGLVLWRDVMKFYCERAEADVNREECEYCEKVEECQKDGYLTEIDKKLDLNPTQVSMQTLAKQLQRAQKYSFPRTQKDAYWWKQTGVLPFKQIPKELFTENELKRIGKILGASVDSEQLHELSEHTKNYLITKAIWENKPDSSKIKADLKTTKKLAEKLANHLDSLNREFYFVLNYAYDDIETFHTNIHKLYITIDEILENTFSRDAWNGGLANLPQIHYYQNLTKFYEAITEKKATVSYNWVKNKDQHSSLEPSQFLLFVHTCIECIDRQETTSSKNT